MKAVCRKRSTKHSRSSTARVAAAKNRYPETIAFLRQSLEKDETTRGLIHLGRIYALVGERAQAVAILERLKQIQREKEINKYVSPAELSILYAALGMREPAFENLERAFAERDLLLPLARVEPEYDALRDDARFADLLRRIDMPSENRLSTGSSNFGKY